MQYGSWLGNALRWDWGISYVHNVPVWEMILGKIPYTLTLGITAFAIAFVISVPIGLHVAVKRNGAVDHISRIVTMFFGTIPSFWLALVLILIFSVTLHWLPTSDMGTARHVILSCITLMVGMIPSTLRITRSSMSEVLGQDYMVTAKSKGLTERQSVYRHALVNVMPPVITMAGLEIGHILGGSVIVETIFVWPGIGKLLYDSIISKDYPMMQGCIVTIALGYIISMLAVDIVTAAIDPRIRLGGGRN